MTSVKDVGVKTLALWAVIVPTVLFWQRYALSRGMLHSKLVVTAENLFLAVLAVIVMLSMSSTSKEDVFVSRRNSNRRNIDNAIHITLSAVMALCFLVLFLSANEPLEAPKTYICGLIMGAWFLYEVVRLARRSFKR